MVHQGTSGSFQRCPHSSQDKTAQKKKKNPPLWKPLSPFQQSWMLWDSGSGGDTEKGEGCAGHQDVDEGRIWPFLVPALPTCPPPRRWAPAADTSVEENMDLFSLVAMLGFLYFFLLFKRRVLPQHHPCLTLSQGREE